MNIINSRRNIFVKYFSRLIHQKTSQYNFSPQIYKLYLHHRQIRNFTVNSNIKFLQSSEIPASINDFETKADKLFSFQNRVSTLTDIELQDVITELRDLRKLEPGKFENSPELMNFKKTIEQECLNRARTWDMEMLMDTLNAYFPEAKFLCYELLFYIFKKKYKRALKSEKRSMLIFIRSMNYYNCWKWYGVNSYLLQFLLKKRIDELTLPEIGDVLSALNRFNAAITNQELLENLLSLIQNNIAEINPVTAGIFVKFLANQQRPYCCKVQFEPLLPRLVERIDDFDLSGARSALKLCITSHIYPPLLEKVSQKILRELPNITAADLQNTLQTLINAGYTSSEFYSKVVETFEQEPLRNNLKTHPKRFAKIIIQLSLVNVYPVQYIDEILSEEFLFNTFGTKLNKHTVIRDLVMLDCNLEIERPGYEGNRLNPKLRKTLLSRFGTNIHRSLQSEDQDEDDEAIPMKNNSNSHVSPYNKIMNEARSILHSLLGGPKYVHLCYLIPHLFKPNLCFALNEKKEPVKIPDNILNLIKIENHPIDRKFNWFVITVAQKDTWNSGPPLLSGREFAKVRLLKKLGYKIIYIFEHDWIGMNDEERYSYISNCIESDP